MSAIPCNPSNAVVVASHGLVATTPVECVDEAIRQAAEMGEVVRCANATHCVRLVGVVRGNPARPTPIEGGSTVLPKGVRIWRVCCGLNTAADSSLDAKRARDKNVEQSGCHVCADCYLAEQWTAKTSKGQVCRPCEIKRHGIADAFERSFAATTFLPKGPYVAKEIETLRDQLCDLQETLKMGAELMATETPAVDEVSTALTESNGDKDVSAARRYAVAESRNGNKGPLRDLQREAERLHDEAQATVKEIASISTRIAEKQSAEPAEVDASSTRSGEDAGEEATLASLEAFKASRERDVTALHHHHTRAKKQLEDAAEAEYDRRHGDEAWSKLDLDAQKVAIAQLMKDEEEYASRPDPSTAKKPVRANRQSKASKSSDARGGRRTIKKPKHVLEDAAQLDEATKKWKARVGKRVASYRAERLDAVRLERAALYRDRFNEKLINWRVRCEVEQALKEHLGPEALAEFVKKLAAIGEDEDGAVEKYIDEQGHESYMKEITVESDGEDEDESNRHWWGENCNDARPMLEAEWRQLGAPLAEAEGGA